MKRQKPKIMRHLSVILLLLFAGLAASHAEEAESQLRNSQVDLSTWNFQEAGLFTFTNEWEYYPSRLIYSADFKTGSNLGVKEFVRIPKDFYNQQEFESKFESNYGTLRTVVKIPRSYIGKQFGIRTTLFYKDAQIYVDGQSIFDESSHSAVWRDLSELKPQMVGEFVPSQQEVEIIIHFSHKYNYTNTYGGVYLGEASQIQRQLVQRLIIDTGLFSALIVLAVFNITFFMRNNRRKSNERLALYFGLLVAVMATRVMNSGEHYLLYFLPNIPGELISKLGYWSYYLLLPLFILFACEVRRDMLPASIKRLSIYALGFFGLFVLMVDSRIYTQISPLYHLYFTIIMIQLVIHTVRSFTLKSQWFKAEFISFAIMIVIFLLDSFYIAGSYDLRNYYLFSILVFMIYVTYMVSKIYSSAVDQLENLTYSHDQLTAEIEKLELQYTENLREKQLLCDTLIEQKDMRLSALEKIAHEIAGTIIILDEQLRIRSAYGQSVEKHLGLDYIGEKFIKYFFGEQTEAGQLYVDILRRVVHLENRSRISTYLSLLPKQAYKQGRYYAFETQFIKETASDQPIFAVVVTDVNKFMQMKQQVEKSDKELKMMIRYAQFPIELKYLIMRLNQFQSKEVDRIIEGSKSADELVTKMIMSLERFAIWFEAFGFDRTYQSFRNFILELDRLQKEVIPIHLDELIHIIKETKINQFDAEDRRILLEHIQVNLEISPETLNEAIKTPRELREIIDIMRPYCEVLAARYGKMLEPVVFEGHSIPVSLTKIGHILRNLSRVFESIIVHNIEYYDERTRLNKPVAATITIRSTVTLTHLIIEIEDDGMGININTLKDSLYKLNLMSFKEIVNATEEAVLPYIFEQDVYYRETDNDYFGIGDGLWLVKQTLERHNGSIRVESSFQSYCRFIVEIPLEEINL